MAQTFLFYDIETTGLNKCFDQVLQFAAIRTDLNLNPIEDYNFLVKPNPDIIPNPYAQITHRISLKHAEKEGMCELDAIEKIHALLNEPGTISLGYNTLGFDDEFLRFSFYRNLLPPYTHQYANQCYRADIYPMAIMYFLFKPAIIEWPKKDGKTSLKLELINNLNKFVSGPAHDALVDVKATLGIAEQFKKEDNMWEYVLDYFNKKTDIERIQKLDSSIHGCPQAIMINGKFGAKFAFHRPVLGLGQHRVYRNQSIWLCLDDPDIKNVTPDTLKDIWSVNKKPGEPGFILPMHDRFTKFLSAQRKELMETNKEWLAAHADIFTQLSNYHLDYTYPKVKNIDIDAALYETEFLTPQELKQCATFHTATPKEKAAMQFSDMRLQEQAVRVLGRNYPDTLSAHQRAMFNEYLSTIQDDNPDTAPRSYQNSLRTTKVSALKDIEEIRKTQELDQEQVELLVELEALLASSPST